MTLSAMTLRTIAMAAAIGIVACTIVVGRGWRTRNDWFALQSQQLALIQQLNGRAPVGWQQLAWNNVLVDLGNVWGNVIYHPGYSGISNAQMGELKRQLEEIVRATDGSNSHSSVDRIYSLLLSLGQKSEFISAYRDEFRNYEIQQKPPTACSDDQFLDWRAWCRSSP